MLNGCLVSLSWVLTLSVSLSKLDPGLLPPLTKVTVHAGLVSTDDFSIGHNRTAVKLEKNVMEGELNAFYPSLVLLKLEKAFSRTNRIRPVVINIGMLSVKSFIVGWAHNPATELTFPSARSFKVMPMIRGLCVKWGQLEHPEQLCSKGKGPRGLNLLEGALMVDQGYLTALHQLNSYYSPEDSSHIDILVRVGFFIAWIDFVVSDSTVNKIFLETNFPDDLYVPPWYNNSSLGSRWQPHMSLVVLPASLTAFFMFQPNPE